MAVVSKETKIWENRKGSWAAISSVWESEELGQLRSFWLDLTVGQFSINQEAEILESKNNSTMSAETYLEGHKSKNHHFVEILINNSIPKWTYILL
jgi:hypothetical protein